MARQSTTSRSRGSRRHSTSSTATSRSRRQGSRRARPARSNAQGKRSVSRRAKPVIGAKERGLQGFLETFTRGLTSGDGQAAAACFEYPSLMVMSAVGEYGGTQAIPDARQAAQFFDRAPEQYHAKGIEETFPDIEDVQWLSDDLAMVRAHFPYIDADGNDMGDGETSVYVVRKAGSAYTVCAAITLGADSDRA